MPFFLARQEIRRAKEGKGEKATHGAGWEFRLAGDEADNSEDDNKGLHDGGGARRLAGDNNLTEQEQKCWEFVMEGCECCERATGRLIALVFGDGTTLLPGPRCGSQDTVIRGT